MNSALRSHSSLRTPKIHYRGYLARRYCSVLYVTENLAIIKLQASVRGFLGRKAVALWHARLVRGAIKIQSFTRGCLSRKNSYEENPSPLIPAEETHHPSSLTPYLQWQDRQAAKARNGRKVIPHATATEACHHV